MKIKELFEAGRVFTIGPKINSRGAPSKADWEPKKKGPQRPETTEPTAEDLAICKKISANIAKAMKNPVADDEMHFNPDKEDVNALGKKWMKTLAKGDLAGWQFDYDHDGGRNPDEHTALVRSMFHAALGKGLDGTYEEWAEKMGM